MSNPNNPVQQYTLNDVLAAVLRAYIAALKLPGSEAVGPRDIMLAAATEMAPHVGVDAAEKAKDVIRQAWDAPAPKAPRAHLRPVPD